MRGDDSGARACRFCVVFPSLPEVFSRGKTTIFEESCLRINAHMHGVGKPRATSVLFNNSCARTAGENPLDVRYGSDAMIRRRPERVCRVSKATVHWPALSVERARVDGES